MQDKSDDIPLIITRTLRALGRDFDGDELRLARRLDSTQILRKFDKVQDLRFSQILLLRMACVSWLRPPSFMNPSRQASRVSQPPGDIFLS